MAPKKHPSDKRFDTFVIAPNYLTDKERESFRSHLASCALCKEHLKVTRLFWRQVARNLRKPPSKLDRDLAKQIFKHVMKKK